MSSRGGYGRRKRDEDEGPILVYGRNPVRELIKAGRREVSEVWVLTQAADDPALEGVAVVVKTREELARAAGTGDHQGMVAFTEEYPYADPQDILEGTGPVIVLDEVQDPRNLGAVARVADAAGCAGLVIPTRGSRVSPRLRARPQPAPSSTSRSPESAVWSHSSTILRVLADGLPARIRTPGWTTGKCPGTRARSSCWGLKVQASGPR